jgi:3-deoxy-D-arabino-heptulosonate 7-phosphate (DAHP) synthase
VAKAAVAAGADGLALDVWEVTADDGSAIKMSEFRTLMEELQPIARAVGRSLR